jgi:hypothetical protein
MAGSADYWGIATAVNRVRSQVRWKSQRNAARHLQKRKSRGHLPDSATIAEYEQLIQTILQDASARVYRYWYNRSAYVAVVAERQTLQWLVMFSDESVMESAFVVDRPEHYLSKPGFEWIGLLGEVLDEL